MNDQSVFIFLGAGGIPLKISAAGNKYILMAKALKKEGFNVKLYNFYNLSSDLKDSYGTIDEFEFRFLSGKKRINSLVDKILAYFKSRLQLIREIRSYKEIRQNKYLLISYCSGFDMIFYRILTFVFGFKLVVSMMEYHPSLAKNIREKLKAFLFDHHLIKISDAVLPISHYLEKFIEKRDRSLPIFRVPVLADFNLIFPKREDSKKENLFFLYCGSLGYKEVIDKIITAFTQLEGKDIELHLVVSGKEEQVMLFKEMLKVKSNIKVYHKLSYKDLLQKYANATALIAPLRNCIQDEARFPQKIAEYLSSGSPIITNPVGEINHFFKDDINVIIADDYSISSLKNAMKKVLDNPEKARKIGERGREVGVQYFHYENISHDFAVFLQNL